MDKVQPQLAWLSVHPQCEDNADLAVEVATRQGQRGSCYVIAMPYTSEVWQDERIQCLLNRPEVEFTRTNLSSFDDTGEGWYPESLYLMTNLPLGSLAPLLKGSLDSTKQGTE